MQKELRSKIKSIQLRIDEASKKILKESNEISLIAVSKKKSSVIRKLFGILLAPFSLIKQKASPQTLTGFILWIEKK
jgi:hypothetical protein